MLSILGWKTVFVPFSLMRLFFAPKEKPVPCPAVKCPHPPHPAERTFIMFSTKEFGQRVSNLRKVRNLTQDELAYRVNVNKGHISRMRRSLIDLAQELHTSTDYLLTGTGPANDFAKEQLLLAIEVLSSVSKLI